MSRRVVQVAAMPQAAPNLRRYLAVVLDDGTLWRVQQRHGEWVWEPIYGPPEIAPTGHDDGDAFDAGDDE